MLWLAYPLSASCAEFYALASLLFFRLFAPALPSGSVKAYSAASRSHFAKAASVFTPRKPTPRGADLLPVLKEIIRWANRHIPDTAAPPPGFLEKIEKQGVAQPERDRHRAKPALQAPRPSRIRKLGKPVRPATVRRKVKQIP